MPTLGRHEEGFVYIMANKRNGTIYFGVTSNVTGRVYEHKEGRGSMFEKMNTRMGGISI